MYRYKIDILQALAARGYNTYKIRKNKILPESTVQRIRNNENITLESINTICLILRCQPSDIIEIVPTDEEKIKYF